MLVRFLGFNFSVAASSLDLMEYINFMVMRHGEANELGEHKRFLFFNTVSSEDYYLGLLVTKKDQKTFCELVDNGGKLRVRVNELDRDSSLMDFNFFVINKVTGMGMYQYYHQSCSLNSFAALNMSRFQAYRDDKIAQEISAIPASKINAAKEREIKRRYKGALKYEVLVRQENLRQLIEELERVKSFEYSFMTLVAEEPEFTPLENYVKKESTKLRFTLGAPIKALAGPIVNFVKKGTIAQGNIIGVDSQGIERVLRITDNPDRFGEYAYDDVAPKIQNLEIAEFEKSWVIAELLNKCHEYGAIFEAKIA